MKKILAGITALAMAITFTMPVAAATKKLGKQVQSQTSSCNKCDKKKAAKAVKNDCTCGKPDCKNCSKAKDCKCNKADCKNCNKTKDGKPCPSDCPKKSK